jgi:hypothetical protein
MDALTRLKHISFGGFSPHFTIPRFLRPTDWRIYYAGLHNTMKNDNIQDFQNDSIQDFKNDNIDTMKNDNIKEFKMIPFTPKKIFKFSTYENDNIQDFKKDNTYIMKNDNNLCTKKL